MNSDPKLVHQTYEALALLAPVSGRRILELGPGHTLEVLAMAKKCGATSCSAVDVIRYADPAKAAEMGIDYRVYGGRRLPFADKSFDLVWAWDVLEHLRRPREVLGDVRRVLTPDGRLICRVDLRDHYHLADESRWLACLMYPKCLWDAMTWFRSSYVNRLRFSQWQKVFQDAGFTHCDVRASTSQTLSALREKKSYLRHYSDQDVATWQFTAVCSVQK